jgi:hypothetical protein
MTASNSNYQVNAETVITKFLGQGLTRNGAEFLVALCDVNFEGKFSHSEISLGVMVAELSKGLSRTEDIEAPDHDFPRNYTRQEQKYLISEKIAEIGEADTKKELKEALQLFSDALTDNNHPLNRMAETIARRFSPTVWKTLGTTR